MSDPGALPGRGTKMSYIDLILIKKDGIYTRWWDGDKREYYSERVEDIHDFYLTLMYRVEVESDVTLRDFIGILREIDAIQVLESIMSLNIESFIEEMNSPVTFKNPLDKIDIETLKITKIVSINKFKSNRELDDHISCSGTIGAETYAIELTPWNQLAEATINLNDQATFYDSEKYKPEDNSHYVGEELTCDFKMLEFLQGLFQELCFHGNPTERDRFAQELMDTCDRIEAGTEPLTSLDDFMASLDKEDLPN